MAKRKKTSPAETRKFIRSLRGKYKPKSGEKPFAEQWAEYKREEKEIEEKKLHRFSPMKSQAQTLREESPAYRVNGNHPPRKLHCIDLFAGCGGLSLGLEEAGFNPLLFSEINPQAAETYIANRTGMDIIPVSDIYNLTDVDLGLLKTYWRYKGIEDIDLVCGGPPCQGYSGIGHRRTFKLDKRDIPSNHLFQEMVRVIRCVRPKMFLFENVRGLLNARWTPEGQSGELFKSASRVDTSPHTKRFRAAHPAHAP
ncbi:MAG TPA: DNA (cytosine-5-)-methyltransferase [Methylomirabilota bacterium]|nr:DNA (cytosine-5-)-methyltransferase [Methylomirabilota bacterium]